MHKWLGFSAMCIGLFMAILDMQIVATSLPTIQQALHISPQAMSWIQTAYIIAEVITIPITGLLTRSLTMRGLFVLGVSIFTVASVGCAATNGFTSLIVWRILQGFAAGTMIPAVFSAVFLLFPPKLETFATSIAGVLAVVAPIVGPIVGGYITQTYSWHWLFLINIIPGMASALLGGWCLPKERLQWHFLRHLDFLGLVWLSIALASFVIGLKQAPNDGWTSWVVICLFVTSGICSWLFLRRSLKVNNPIAALSVLSDRRVMVACILNFTFGFGFFGATYLMPVFLALVREHNALEIGKVMLVTGVAQMLSFSKSAWMPGCSAPSVLPCLGLASP